MELSTHMEIFAFFSGLARPRPISTPILCSLMCRSFKWEKLHCFMCWHEEAWGPLHVLAVFASCYELVQQTNKANRASRRLRCNTNSHSLGTFSMAGASNLSSTERTGITLQFCFIKFIHVSLYCGQFEVWNLRWDEQNFYISLIFFSVSLYCLLIKRIPSTRSGLYFKMSDCASFGNIFLTSWYAASINFCEL